MYLLYAIMDFHSLAQPDPSAQAREGLVSRLYLICPRGIGGM